MLATAHAAASCPFRSDAERWLLEEETKRQSHGFVVPPYLLPMSDEFVLLENVGAGGLVSRRMIRVAAVELSEYLERSNMGVTSLALSVPQQVANLVEKEDIDDVAVNDGIVGRLGSLFFSVLGGELREGDDESQDMAKVLSDDDEDDFSELATNVPLLAAFGWRAPSKAQGTVGGVDDSAIVECRLCLARSVVSCDTGADAPPTKRRRTDANVPKTMDLLNSHRHFCPYVCGRCSVGSKESESEAAAGWKAIVSMIIKQYRDKENRLSVGKEGGSGERTFHSVRSLLRSAFLSHGGA